MIIALKNTLDAVLNHKQMGKISTDEFNAMLPQVVNDIQSSLFAEFRKMNFKKMRWQDTPNYGNEAHYLKQAIEYFITESEIPLVDSKADIQNHIRDFMLINSVFTDKAESEKVDLLVFNKLQKNSKTKPTKCMPVYTLNGSLLKVYPKIDSVSITYFRKAKTPKLTSKIILEKEVFDDSAPDFQDIDLHPVMLEAVFLEMLGLFGINLQDQFAMQMSSQLKQEEMIEKQ